MKKEVSKAYINRCLRVLKKWNAPLEGWHCQYVHDVKEDGWIGGNDNGLFTCELCGCCRVRFVHVMEHEDWFEPLYVGCICAGVMEGDILAAQERERQARNRAKRKRSFIERKWSMTYKGDYTRQHNGKRLTITKPPFMGSQFGVVCNGTPYMSYKGKPITNFLSAACAAFDIADPPIRGSGR